MLNYVKVPESSVMFIIMLLAIILAAIFAFAWARMVLLRHKDYRKESQRAFVNLVKTKIHTKKQRIIEQNLSKSQRQSSLTFLNQIENKLNNLDLGHLNTPLQMESFFNKNEIEFLK